jgi:P27 family predicted phage terminase small subunit
MGRRGPAPRPAGLKIVEGRSEGRDSGGRRIPLPPSFVRAAPEPPDDLTDVELALWERVVDDRGPAEQLKDSDYGILLLYVQAFSQYFAAKRLVVRGMLIKNPQTGVLHRNPAVTVLAECRRDLIRIGAELGLSPASEQRLAAAAFVAVDDPDIYDATRNPFAG